MLVVQAAVLQLSAMGAVPELPFVIMPANRSAPAVRWHGELSWGVAAAKSDDSADPTPYHAFVDVVAGGCGLGSWATNSEVWHAVSASPQGPFQRKERVLPTFASNPQLTRAPDGTYLLFTIGAELSAEQTQNCTPGATHPAPSRYAGNATNLHTSKSLNGPWVRVRGSHGSPVLLAGFTNPTAHVLPNGTVVVLGIPQGCCTCDDGGCLHAATAPTWAGPYTIHAARGLFGWPNQGGHQPNDREFVFEDPFLWWSPDRRRWNLLVHQYNQTDPSHQRRDGGYAVSQSEDLWGGWDWGGWQAPAYTARVDYTDGIADSMIRRERPFLLFDAGVPTTLFTAVCPPGDTTNAHCYSIANPLATPAA